MNVDRLLASGVVTRIEHHPSLGSTNDYCRQYAAELPRNEVLLVVADEQTAGRGRGTNRWWTGAGSLAFSLLFDPMARNIDRRHYGMIALAAGVATVESVTPLLSHCELGLHWPNDIFAAGRKLGGILVEGLPDGRHILGLGLNVNNTPTDAPGEVAEIATSLVALTGETQDRVEVLFDMLVGLDRRLEQLAAAPDELGRRADELCLQHGRVLTVRNGTRDQTGVCRGIAPDGALLLDSESGRETVYSGVIVKR
jgi:BirA family biotin operon repressor/biotin-[acetyl-CoA-carboxylase] ligase